MAPRPFRTGTRPGGLPSPYHWLSEATMLVVVFHCKLNLSKPSVSHLCYTSHVTAQAELESNSTGSSCPADHRKSVPLTVVSLGSS